MLPSKPYSPPLVTSPLRNDQHTHTMILLGGRGSNGDRLGHVFIEATGIAKRFPTTKFIFPTATKRRPIVLKQIPINQWFDNYTLEGPNTRTDLQLDGLEKSSEFLRKLIEEEAALLSNNLAIGDRYSRVVIGRLSKGCAASVFCLLGGSPSAEKKPFGGVIVFFYHQQHDLFLGMSGWLPFEREIAGLLKIDEGDQGKSESEEDDDDPFAHDTDGDDAPAHIQAVNHIRDILGISPLQSDTNDSEDRVPASYLNTPVFLDHGSADPKVAVDLGRWMAFVLSDGLEMDVTWKAYDEFRHWYKVPDGIDDVIRFLKEKTGFVVVEQVE